MPVRPLHILLLWLLVISVLAGPVNSFGYVWCVTTDGHVVLEAARDGDCATTATPCDLAGPASVMTDVDDCGQCLDISASPPWSLTRGRDGSVPVALPALHTSHGIIAILPVPASSLPAGSLPAEDPPRIPAQILAHRTIVLLI